ncbi:hypothetical protein I79_001276 [Cricetulus griseus]|uniref:Uncharacterized protein n=1 Tax=Cricetulus griseus TaxID=10029 RepID=G3GUC2_CRIGR|nr:hypothetical protein I79_001276 [Cricetulus griseus]
MACPQFPDRPSFFNHRMLYLELSVRLRYVRQDGASETVLIVYTGKWSFSKAADGA